MSLNIQRTYGWTRPNPITPMTIRCAIALGLAAWLWPLRLSAFPGGLTIADHADVERTSATPSGEDEKAKQPLSIPGRPLVGPPPGADVARLEAELAAARKELEEHPNDPERIIWVGRRLGYLWRMQEAIEVYTQGLKQFPDHVALLRHRGHRYISLRQFDQAINDLQQAAKLCGRMEDVVEKDGQPNAGSTPLTTLKFNVWYHLGVAKYLQGDYWGAREAFVENVKYCGGHDDNIVAVSDWLYLTARKLRKLDEADRYLASIRQQMRIVENHAYHRRLLLYKGMITPDELLSAANATGVDSATLRYGLAEWHLHNNRRDEAVTVLEEVVAGDQWPAFGYIAAEVALKDLKK
jgi:tetratricopeptide (TPR) repeat protein